ncbi:MULTISPECIES: DsbA family oxidoreductase [unclassified Brevibacterium]|uniref:DsbA family oxidoreductase n=1 Tax=unclassified Brevibacterium TaxID=2614124 RepID=UPI0010925431|nr:DsbA family oxidoreductase [Brevibacterium sp. S22]TGD32544.1 DsbA family oxidoreductase [Brevibacterium sp. S22]
MIDIRLWADVRCPWCWIGHRRLQEARAHLGEGLIVRHRSFLLEPEGPLTTGQTLPEVATSEWGMTEQQWARLSTTIRDAGREVGLDISIDTALRVDSRAAHRLLHAAKRRALNVEAAWEIVFAAHLTENLDISSPQVLAELGRRMGLHRSDVEAAVDSPRLDKAVRDDHDEAVRRGFPSVPTYLLGDHSLSGARTAEDIAAFLDGKVVSR